MKYYYALYPDKSIRTFWASSYDSAWRRAEEFGVPETVERTSFLLNGFVMNRQA
jgi:hypothetical protein